MYFKLLLFDPCMIQQPLSGCLAKPAKHALLCHHISPGSLSMLSCFPPSRLMTHNYLHHIMNKVQYLHSRYTFSLCTTFNVKWYLRPCPAPAEVEVNPPPASAQPLTSQICSSEEKPSLPLPGALPVKWVWNTNVVLFRLCSVCVLSCKLWSAPALRSFHWYPVSINADLNKHPEPNCLVLLTWHCICYGTLETGRLYPARQKHPQLYHTLLQAPWSYFIAAWQLCPLTIIWWPHTSIATVCTVCTRLRCDLTTWLPLPEYIFCYSSASYSLSVVSFLTHFLPAATGLLVSSARHTGNGELAEPCAALFLGWRLCKGSGVLYTGFLWM